MRVKDCWYVELQSGHSEYELETGEGWRGGAGNAAADFLSLEDEIYVGLLSARMRLKELMQY